MEKDSKIYVAGHRGLVGSAIWSNLLEKGYTNLVGRSSKELDLTDLTAVAKFFEEEKPEYVFLAAAKVGGIVANNIYRADFIHQNLVIQNNVIFESWRNEVKKLLFLGSTCIYPKEAPQPMSEEALLTGPLEYTNEPYAIAKIAGMKMCESFNLQYGTNFISVMPTNLYGPNDNFDLEKSHVLPAMIRKMHLAKGLMDGNWDAIREDLDKRPIKGINGSDSKEKIELVLNKYGLTNTSLELWGTGKPMREFLWSEEMADACVFIMERVNFSDLKTGNNEQTGNNGQSENKVQSDKEQQSDNKQHHINIGTGKEISIRNLADLIKNTVGYKGDVSFDSSKPDGTMRKLTDVTKLNGLGWTHTIEIDEGVKRMYEWYLK